MTIDYIAIPKTEIHLHLEGAIPLPALWQLVQKYGGDPEIPCEAALAGKFVYRDFPHFIDTWIWKNRFIREYDDFTFIAQAFAEDLLRQKICYAEAYFSPTDFAYMGLEMQELAAAIRRGLARTPGVEVALIVDLVRDTGPESGMRTLAKAAEVRDQGIIGIGIGGSEQVYPPEVYAAVYEQARKLGFHTTAHAGEVAGAESIWGALRALQVERIGHGTRAFEDPALLDVLAERQIPIEMCPHSNVCTGAVRSLEEHPIRRYFERGLLVSVNTDDPHMFGNNLAQEYQWLVEHQGFSEQEILVLIRNGIQSTWLPPERKKELLKQIT